MLPTFVQRPAEPDVTYAYDVLGRATSVVHAAAVPTGATSTERTFHWRLPMTVQRTETVSTPPAVVAAHHRTFGVDLRVADRADTVGAVQRVGTVEYDDKGRVKDVASAPGDPLTYQHDVLSRRERTDVQSTPAAAREYTYVTAGTELVRVDNTPNTAETLDLMWDSQGRVRRRIMSGPPATVTEDLSYGYHDRLLRVVVDDQGRTGGCPASEQTDSSNHSDHETWAYRYGPGGLREQKRLVTDQLDDRTVCGVAPWTHYVRSPGGDPLVVYHGRQTSENPCSVTGLGLYDRRVHIYAHEYRVYGPDGLRVLFERNAEGVFVKRAVTLDAQGSIATVTDAAGYQHAEIHDDHGERTTVPQRRTGWLDRELDYETAPGHVRHKLYDLDHRKYDAATAQFLSVDPLWPMFISSGSYVYCTGDAVNKIDPWGLGERIDNPLSPHPGTSPQPGTGTSPLSPGTDLPMIVGHEAEYYRGVGVWLYDIAIGRYLRGLGATGDGIGPYGSGPGQSWVASPRGIGPGGKEGVGFWSGRGATAETAVQLKGVTVTAMRIPRTTWDAITTARILKLDERVQQPAFDFINAVETELGVRLRVSQARRSIEEQNRIWQMGRDANGRKVGVTYTNVKGGMSAHNFGLAIDVVIYPKVNTAIPVSVAQIGERYGFEWGGRWSDPKDYPHFQMFWINGRGPR